MTDRPSQPKVARPGSEVVAYLSHTLGRANGDHTIKRHDNIANAGKWLHYLTDAVPWIVVMPWFPYVALDIQRERGLADQLRYIRRCDALVLCGGVVSDHQVDEVAEAKAHGVAIVDLTDLGYYAPEISPGTREMLESRLEAARLV